jgi:hypothetical protein
MGALAASLVSVSFGVAGGMIIYCRIFTKILAFVCSDLLNVSLT